MAKIDRLEAMRLVLTIGAALMLTVTHASAQRDATSVAYWKHACSEPAGSRLELACVDYLLDSVRTHAALVRSGRVSPYFCVPALVSGTQIKDVVVRYLADNPQYLEADFGEVVTVALARGFPCVD